MSNRISIKGVEVSTDHYINGKRVSSEKKFTVNFKLQAGDILCFDNRRVLHGRTSFDPNSGQRHLQGYYMDRDEILGRLNFLKKIEV